MTSSAHRERARNALAGHWGTAILVCFVAGLLGGSSSSSFTSSLNMKLNSDYSTLPPETAMIFATILGLFATIAIIMSLVYLVLGGVVQLGSAKYHLNLIDQKEATFSDLFSQFSRFGSALVMNLLTGIFILLWTFLLVIPGIIASYSYSMAPYIMLEDPNCGGYEAIRRSKQLMKGHKGDLFLLDLSFIGWSLLCILTLGIGSLWLVPYMNTARASFYRDITHPQPESQQGYTTVEF